MKQKKPPSRWATNDIDSHSVFWKAVIFIQNKALHHGCLELLEQLDNIGCIGKYLWIEKMAFCWYLNLLSWCSNFLEQYFPCQHFNLHEERCREHFSEYCNSYFPTTQINGFTYIMSEAVVPSFRSYNCSEHIWIYRWKSPYFNNNCMWKLYLGLDFNCQNLSLLCLLTQLTNSFAD